MKIERLNENQLRFTVWTRDLPDEDFTIADLAGQTEKAEELIKYMMNKAREEFGFSFDEKPIVVEAIPVNKDCIVFLVTKVDEEEEEQDKFKYIEKLKKQAMEMAKSFKENGIKNEDDTVVDEVDKTPQPQDEKTGRLLPYMIYSSSDMENFVTAARVVKDFYDSDNTLYKKENDITYYLVVTHNRNSDDEFTYLCDTLKEFTEPYKFTYTTKYYFEEHYKKILDGDALQRLAEL